MELKQLKIFLSVYKNRNFSKAAKELYLTQPNVSQHIKALEEEFDTTFFIRDRHNVEVTADGELFYQFAKNMYDIYDRMKYTFSEVSSKRTVQVRFNVFPFSFVQGVSSAITDYFAKIPNASVTIEPSDNFRAYKNMDAGETDFAVLKLGTDKKLDRFVYIPLIMETVHVVMNKKNPFSKKEYITAQDLTHLPLMTGSVHSHIYSDLMGLFSRENFKANTALKTTLDTDLLIHALSANTGVMLGTPSLLKALGNDELTSIPLHPVTDYGMYFVYPKGYVPNEMINNLIPVLRKAANYNVDANEDDGVDANASTESKDAAMTVTDPAAHVSGAEDFTDFQDFNSSLS